MRYINKYATSSEVQTDLDNGLLGKPYVVYIEQDNMLDWNSKERVDYTERMLTFNILSGGTIVWKASSTAYTTTISYSKDSGATWTDITATTAGTSFNVDAGDKVMFKGDNDAYGQAGTYSTFNGSTAEFEVEGNIMSLIDSTGFTTATTLISSYSFMYLFSGCTGLTSAENLVLPATALTSYCYTSMFNGCTSLKTAPSELPATTLVEGCYTSMFSNCMSLTSAPELPATTSANWCYQGMFQGCTRLNYIKCLATDISASYCTYSWVSGVSETGTFVQNPNMSSWTIGANGIPHNWEIVDSE